MATLPPLVVDSDGLPKQLQSSDTLAVSGVAMDSSNGLSSIACVNSGSSTQTSLLFKNISGGADKKNWVIYSAPSLTFGFAAYNDALSTNTRFFAATRSAGAAVGQIQMMENGVGQVLIGTSTNTGTGDILQVAGSGSFTKPVNLGQYLLTTLPSAASYKYYLITVTNATGGAKLCQSDGSNWNLINTTTAVS